MISHPVLFDAHAVSLHRLRAAPHFTKHNFLLHHIAERIGERLDELKRDFAHGLSLGFGNDLTHHPKARTWHTAPPPEEDILPYSANTYDLICATGLHWINDLPGMLIQLRQLLKPEGLLLAVLPGGTTLHELRSAIMEASLASEGGAAPRIAPFIDARDGATLLQRTGFNLPVADTDTLTIRYTHALQLMHDLRFTGETNALISRPKHFTRRTTMQAIIDTYHQRFQGEDGRIPATFELVTLTGWNA